MVGLVEVFCDWRILVLFFIYGIRLGRPVKGVVYTVACCGNHPLLRLPPTTDSFVRDGRASCAWQADVTRLNAVALVCFLLESLWLQGLSYRAPTCFEYMDNATD